MVTKGQGEAYNHQHLKTLRKSISMWKMIQKQPNTEGCDFSKHEYSNVQNQIL